MAAFGNNYQHGIRNAPVAETPNFIQAAKQSAEHERLMLAAKRQREQQTLQNTAQLGGELYRNTGYNPVEAAQYGINKVKGNEAGNQAIRDMNKAQVDGWQAAGKPPMTAATPGATTGTAAGMGAGAPAAAGGALQAATAAPLAAGGSTALGGLGGAATGLGAGAGMGLAGGGTVAGPMSLAPVAGMSTAGTTAGTLGALGSGAAGAGAGAAGAGAASTLGAGAGAGAAGAGAAGTGMLAAAGPIGWAALAALAIYGLMSA